MIKIQGITVELNGDTTGLNDALKSVDKQTKSVQSELKSVDKLLKFDPSNVELLSQKQQLLGDAVNSTSQRLDALKQAQSEVERQFANGDIGADQYRAFQRELVATEGQLDSFRKQLNNVDAKLEVDVDASALDKVKDKLNEVAGVANDVGGKIGDGLKKGAEVGAKAIAGVGLAATGAVAGVGAFVESQKEMSTDLARLKTNAETAGFSLESVEAGFKKVAAVSGEADSAVEAMSNLMATDMSENQLAEMLDYVNGAAIKFSDTLKTEGIADGIQETFATGEAIGPFAELLERSGVNLDVFNKGLANASKTGTETDYVLQQLSELGLKSTYDAYLENNSAIADYNLAQVESQKKLAEFSDVLRPFVTTLMEMGNIILDVVLGNKDLATGFGELVTIISELGTKFLNAAKDAMPKFIEGIQSALPKVLEAGIKILTKVIEGIGNTLPKLTSKGLELIEKLASTLIANLPKLLNAGVKMVTSLIGGISNNLPKLVATALNLVLKLASTIISNLPKIIEAGVKILTSIVVGIGKALPQLVTYLVGTFIPKIVKIIADANWKQIGKDIINGLIKGIRSMTKSAIEAITGVVGSVVNAAKKFLGIASPSKVFTQIGKWTGEGLALGIDDSQSTVRKAIEELSGILIDVAENNIQQEKEIRKKADADILKLRKDAANKIADLEKKSNDKILGIQESASKKKKGMTAAQQRALVNSRSETANKILKIEEDTAAKIANIESKARSDSAKLISINQKEVLEEIKLFISDKQSLEQMNLIQEAAIWEKSLSLFEEGTKERVEAQKAYQKSLETINTQIVSTNNKYVTEMQRIDDNFVKQSTDLTNKYETTLEAREKALFSFAGMFDAFDATIEESGADLLKNLDDQVGGFKEWQAEIKKLSAKAIDDGLVAELETMGPKALGEIKALNSLSESELQKYSDLYKEKAALARSQAEKELVPMKKDTEKHINDLRKIADAELSKLETEWTKEIKAITSGTANELKSLESIGKDAVRGLISGMESMHSDLRAKAKVIGETVSKATADALKVKSPSRVMMEIGEWSVAGLVMGLDNNQGKVKTASKSLAQTIMDAFYNGTSLNPDNFVDEQLKSLADIQNQMVAIESKTAKDRTSIQEDFMKKRMELDAKYAHVFEAREKELQRIKDATDEENFRIQAEQINRHLMILFGNDINDHGNAATKLYEEEREALEAYEKELAERFTLEKKFVEESKKLNLLSLTDELDMYEKFAQMYSDDSEQRKYYEQQAVTVRQTINDKLLSLNEEYTKKIQESNSKLLDDELRVNQEYQDKIDRLKENALKKEQDLNKEYQDAYESRAKSLYNSYRLFDQAKASRVSGQRLTKNLESQLKVMEEWQGNINSLANRGISGDLLTELREMGPDAAGEIAALNRMSDGELKQYVSLWKEKSNLARSQAEYELSGMREDTARQISALRKETAKQLTGYQSEWDSALVTLRENTSLQLDIYKGEWAQKISEIRTGTKTELENLVTDMPTIGANTIQGMMDGLASMTPALLSQAQSIANAIKETIQTALGIHSPSRVMRGFGINIGQGLVEGMDNMIGKVAQSSARLSDAVVNAQSSLALSAQRSMTHGSTVNKSSTTVDKSKSMNNTFNIYTQESPETAVKREMRKMLFSF